MRKITKNFITVQKRRLVIYPLEDWQIWQMDSLIAMDRQDEAMVLYETTTELLYKELGLTPSDQMKERFRQLEVYQHDKADHVNEIQEGLNQREKDDGAFFCSYLSFMEGYSVCAESDRAFRAVCLSSLCTMTDGKGVPLEKGERLGKVAEELEQAIRNSLRRGDMFTRYSDNQFLMLAFRNQAGGLCHCCGKN
ncbi:MAG: bacterial transcriptional activator domain-containing protein [Roseburia inulinivorans]